MQHCYWIPPQKIQLTEKEIIQKQLEELDKKSIRDAEDIYDLFVSKGIIIEGEDPDLPFVKQRKEEKKELRKKLKELEE